MRVKRSGIYAVLLDGVVGYVGSSVDITNRWGKHKTELRYNKHHSPYFQNVWNKYGEKAFEWVILEQDIPKELLVAREQFFMDIYKPAWNWCSAAGSRLGSKQPPEAIEKVRQANLGKKRTPEARARMSEAMKGNQNNLGNKHTEESKALMRERALQQNHAWLIGREVSEETREKISAAQRGKSREWQIGTTRSEDTKAKMSEKARGNDNGAKSYEFIDPDGNEIVITNLAAFEREHGIGRGSLRMIVQGRRKSCFGYRLKQSNNAPETL